MSPPAAREIFYTRGGGVIFVLAAGEFFSARETLSVGTKALAFDSNVNSGVTCLTPK